jgi:hypothetical protein
MTPTLKLRREVINEKRLVLIEEMYGQGYFTAPAGGFSPMGSVRSAPLRSS